MEEEIKNKIKRYHNYLMRRKKHLFYNPENYRASYKFYKKAENVYGFFDPDKKIIYYNIYHVKIYEKVYKEIIKHEIAHVLDYIKRGYTFKVGKQNIYHGKSWMNICKLLKMKNINRFIIC